jgi:hypothetical protein
MEKYNPRPNPIMHIYFLINLLKLQHLLKLHLLLSPAARGFFLIHYNYRSMMQMELSFR